MTYNDLEMIFIKINMKSCSHKPYAKFHKNPTIFSNLTSDDLEMNFKKTNMESCQCILSFMKIQQSLFDLRPKLKLD